jgi:coenzyme F420 hydrogenase subunit beta
MAPSCGRACQFIQPDYAGLETDIHGRPRDQSTADEGFFGAYLSMHRASLRPPRDGAQWTGLTTRLGERLLETGAVDVILTVVPDETDRWKPVPALITDPAAMKAARGMRMGYAPLLSLLEPAKDAGHKKIGVIGIPCQIYALRAIEAELEFDAIYVIGTPCSDNTTTENFHTFLGLLTDKPETVSYLEFRADYQVELRFDDGARREIPFLKLPISDLPSDFFPITCRTCVDYTNTLSDITVGYMGGEGEQWVIVRNERGRDLLASLGDEVHLEEPGSRGKRAGSVKGFLENTRRAAGGLPLRRMPDWMRGIMGWLMPRIGPKGLEFARTRVEMKAIETVLHLRRHHPKRMKHMVPDHVWRLVAPYGLTPDASEKASKDSEE